MTPIAKSCDNDSNNLPPGSLEEIVTSMAVVDPRLDYYAVTLTVDLAATV
jgi:hypothetical protein